MGHIFPESGKQVRTAPGEIFDHSGQCFECDCASILQKTLDEEKIADETSLAEGKIDLRAASRSVHQNAKEVPRGLLQSDICGCTISLRGTALE